MDVELRKPRCEGYLLVTVVVMIAVASLLLARIAGTSMRIASIAIEEEREMRHRWAVTSLRRLSLDAASALLASQRPSGRNDGSAVVAKPILWRNVDLAGQTWRVVVADESAKLNLLHLSHRHGEEVVRRSMEELLSGRIRVRPATELSQLGKRSVVRWGPWLEAGSGNQVTSPRLIASATQRLTLWGDGRLNVCRSDTETIDVLWHQLYGRRAPQALHEIRRQTPPPTTRQLIGVLALRESQATVAREWLATESTCHSVWVFCQTDRRVSSSMYVEWGRGGATTEHRGYEY